MKPPIIPQWKNECDTSNFIAKMYDEKEIVNPFFIKFQNTNQEVVLNINFVNLTIFPSDE